MSVKIYTRMCANTLDWQQPSGKVEKSINPSFERDFGYGFEEWNFSNRHVMDGWTYLYLEGMRWYRPNKHSGLDILLYTRRKLNRNSQIQIIGEIKGGDWEFVDFSECCRVLQANPSFQQNLLADIRTEVASEYSVNLQKREEGYYNQLNGISIGGPSFKLRPSIFNLRVKRVETEKIVVQDSNSDPYDFLYKSKRYQLQIR